MFDHVKFGVSDYAASKAFFLKALEPLGVAVVSEGPPTYGIELSPDGKASLCMFQTEEKPAHLHLAFTAENRQQVEAFYSSTGKLDGRGKALIGNEAIDRGASKSRSSNDQRHAKKLDALGVDRRRRVGRFDLMHGGLSEWASSL